MKTIIENNDMVVTVYDDKKILHHKIKKYLFGDSFRINMMKAADAFEQYCCTKWLSDDRESSALRPDDVEWAQKEWEPRVLKAGWKHWALVLPTKMSGQMNMKRLVEHYKSKGLNVQAFSDPDSAKKWLEAQ